MSATTPKTLTRNLTLGFLVGALMMGIIGWGTAQAESPAAAESSQR